MWEKSLHSPMISLRSKRFRRVSEQKKSEERDFRSFSRAKNGARAKNERGGVGGGEEGRKRLQTNPMQDFENRPRCLICLSDLMLS